MLGASAIAILHSLGMLALMAVGISMLQPSRLAQAAGWLRSLLMGLVFGATVSIVMIDPVTLPPGATLDARGGPAMLAGVYGGPLVAGVTAAFGAATRLWIGGAGAPGGVLGFVLYAAIGIAARSHLQRRGRRPTTLWLLGFALVGTVCSLPSFFLYPDWRTGLAILSQGWWLLLAGNLVGVVVLGTMLEQDWGRRRLEEELRQTEKQTRAAADAKTRFVAAMSHEIRTPMNAVVGFVDLLRDSNLDGFQRRCTEQIRDAAHGLLRIIDDLLDYAKIESGRVTLDRQPTDVAALIEGCREMLMPQIESKGIACTLDLADGMPMLEVDPVRLRQVLLNLLGNAVKFTDAGRIALIARYQPGPAGEGEIIIVVADTGIGMTLEERDRLFQPFAQGDHIGRGGTGLGLVISRMLVLAMGGELDLVSGLGVGTTVTLRIPAREAADTRGAPGAAVPADPPRGGLRVLVAEDVALNAEMLEATLEQSGHVVRVVSDGAQAVDAVRSEAFDIVLMDVQMPSMDGLAATRAIRRLGGQAAVVPIVALTAYASREDLKACLDAGMNDFLTKPLERPKLQQVLMLWAGAAPEAGTDATAAKGADIATAVAAPAEDVERVSELLARLTGSDRGDRDTLRDTAGSLAAAAGAIGLDGLAERARRLATASARSNSDALGALVEDVTDAGRRSLEALRRQPSGEGR